MLLDFVEVEQIILLLNRCGIRKKRKRSCDGERRSFCGV